MIPTIVIPVLNRYDLLSRCVASMDFPVENLLIINNGNEAVVVEKRATNQVVLNMPTNLGVGPSWNLGIKCFHGHRAGCFSTPTHGLNRGRWLIFGRVAEGTRSRWPVNLAGAVHGLGTRL